MTLRLLPIVFLLLISLAPAAYGFELQPLATRNLSPATIGFGLPTPGPARTLAPGSGSLQLVVDLVSNSTRIVTADESLLFDGETYRFALSADYTLDNELEVGFSLPLISHQGGFLDNFIEGWHDIFGLPQGIRNQITSNQLDYSYSRTGGDGFSLQSGTTGLGDVSLRAAWQLLRDDKEMKALALRASLKLPVGSAKKLTGSGSTDLAIWFSGERRRETANGQVALFGSAGGLVTSNGDLLADQRRNVVGFFSLGLGWQPWAGLGFQLQYDGHSSFYNRSKLAELADFAGQLTIGGSLELNEQTVLELAVTEDIIVYTSPDVVFHLALRRQF